MILVLANCEKVKIWRQNCGYEYKTSYDGKWHRDLKTNQQDQENQKNHPKPYFKKEEFEVI